MGQNAIDAAGYVKHSSGSTGWGLRLATYKWGMSELLICSDRSYDSL